MLFSALFRRPPRPQSVTRSTPRRSFVPRLEALEDRTALSTLTVLNVSDHDPGSLRAVLAAASKGDQIVFDPALNGQTITLTSGELLLNKDLTISGPGAGLLTISGNESSRVFEVARGATVSLSGLTARNGHSDPSGGGILNAGTLTLSNATVSGNHVDGGGGDLDYGGGIYNAGTLTVQNSTVTGNEARGVPPGYVGFESGRGGGIYNVGTLAVANSTVANNTASLGAGILNDLGPLVGFPPHHLPTIVTISNSTIAGNWSYVAGGGIDNVGTQVTLSDSTIAGNTASQDGGGIRNASTLNLRNTILAGNTDGGGEPDLCGHLASSGYNLIGNSQGGSGFVASDLLSVDPLLDPLQNNGGPTPTMALLPGSPVLNAGDPDQLGVADQRGVARSGGVNIGAYQASASAFVLSAPATVTAGTPFDVTVKAVDVFGQTAYGYTSTVTFSTTDPDPGVVLPAAYTFTAGDQGTHTFSGGFTLMTPGAWALTAADLTGGLSANVSITVTGGGGGGQAPAAPRPPNNFAVVDRLLAARPAELAWLAIPGP
jgi:hypothetical protein